MKTIPEDQVGMVIAWLRLLGAAILTHTLDDELCEIVADDGVALPSSDEIDALVERLSMAEDAP
jgi:hypothetical protein